MRIIITAILISFSVYGQNFDTPSREYEIPVNLNNDNRIILLRKAFTEYGEYQLNTIYKLVKSGIMPVNEYKIKLKLINDSHGYARDVISKITSKSHSLNKLPKRFKIYFEGGRYKFVLSNNTLDVSQMFSFLK